MIQRLLIGIAGALVVIFLPYFIGKKIDKNDNVPIIIRWVLGAACTCGVLAIISLAIAGIIRLYHWILTGQ